MVIFLLSVVFGLAAAAVVLLAGYKLGLAKGARDRNILRRELQGRDDELRFQLHQLTTSLQHHESTQQTLENELRRYVHWIGESPSDAEHIRAEFQAMLAPLMERERADDDLRAAMNSVLAPLMQREKIGRELAGLDLGTGQRQELPRLLDGIASTGGFSDVVLVDESGLPLAASSGTTDIERYAGVSSLLMILVDRLQTYDGADPVAVSVYNSAHQQLISRVFTVAGQRLLLTAVANGGEVSPSVLDPALSKLETVLTPQRLGL